MGDGGVPYDPLVALPFHLFVHTFLANWPLVSENIKALDYADLNTFMEPLKMAYDDPTGSIRRQGKFET